MLNVLVLHGYVQPASTVQYNTRRLQAELSDIANLVYAEGPIMKDRAWGDSRPWWVLKSGSEWLDPDNTTDRWNDTVKWWSEHLSTTQYDGIIGLSQGSAMTALLLAMLTNPASVPGFEPKKIQPIKFAILCSGFISQHPPHKHIYDWIPSDVPTLHTLDNKDGIVSAHRTEELANLFGPNAIRKSHNEGHSVPVQGTWPREFREFIAKSVQESVPKCDRPVPDGA